MAIINFKGGAKSIVLDDTRAEALKEKWSDPNTPKTDIVNLGTWAGQYSEIKSIEIEPKHKDVTESYSDGDIRRTGEEIAEIKNKFPALCGVKRELKWLEDKGAIVIKDLAKHIFAATDQYHHYARMYSAWNNRQGEIQYAEKMRLKQLSPDFGYRE